MIPEAKAGLAFSQREGKMEMTRTAKLLTATALTAVVSFGAPHILAGGSNPVKEAVSTPDGGKLHLPHTDDTQDDHWP
ncbi:hypothetical protein ACIQNG_00345 [Streptomyces sp. NPDC091377]|uniref:hypothetical protein n=1 Tax=Streptomyces sp. NPDC091377 TaxID=3365995 RepID=UPI00380AE682